ncbi:MAG: invasion associated locus B family protein [Micropepsaceae bacterium]
MSNSNTLPWLVAVLATAIGAGAIGFFARPYVDGPTVAAAPAEAPAQEQRPSLPAGTTSERMDDWTLICTPSNEPSKPICFAAQDIMTDDKQLLMALLAGYDGQARRSFLVRTPLGVRLEQGLIFQMGDDKPAAFAFSSCNEVSCDAQLIIPEGNFEKLEAAGSFNLVYVLADGRPVKGTVSMKGLGKAYEKIIKPEVKEPAATPEAAPAPAGETPAPTPKPATP